MSEIIQSFRATQQWWTLAMFDIRQRYRRSTLGPLWITLSTGIIVGLCFTISTSTRADIVLMDELLSVGDAEFQEKASERLNHMVNQASILVLASHSTELLEKACNRIVRMEHGKIVDVLDNVPPAMST